MSSAAAPLSIDLAAMTPDQVAQLLAQLQQIQGQQAANAAPKTNTDREDATREQESGGARIRVESERAVSTSAHGDRATPKAGASRGTQGPESEAESVVRRRKAKGKQRAVEAAPEQTEPESHPAGACQMRDPELLPAAEIVVLVGGTHTRADQPR